MVHFWSACKGFRPPQTIEAMNHILRFYLNLALALPAERRRKFETREASHDRARDLPSLVDTPAPSLMKWNVSRHDLLLCSAYTFYVQAAKLAKRTDQVFLCF